MLDKSHPSSSIRALALSIALLLPASGVQAQEVAAIQGQQDNPGPLAKWLQCDGMLGDCVGVRKLLCDRGVVFFGGYTSEVWGNTTGGLERGSVYTGMLDFGVNLDLEKAVGWKGASISTTWLWLSGKDASADLTGNFMTVSNIAGFNTLRMYQMWFQQNLLEDKISLRAGQLAADAEFVTSDYAGTFINGTFGWPPFLYMNTPEGGPGYPMGTLGARLAIKPVDWLTFQTAAFQGNVFAQDVNRHGFRWNLNSDNGYFFINEAQFRWNHRDAETGLPGQFKAGAWFQSGQFTNPGNGDSVTGDCGFYAIVDQMLYREPSPAGPVFAGKDGKSAVDGKASKTVAPVEQKSDQGLGWFGRAGFGPQDRNYIGFYFDTGLTYKGLIPSRDNDKLGVGFGYAQLSRGAQQQAIDSGSVGVGAEMVIECTYQAQITKWLSVQPDLQFIVNPGGNQDLGNALVIGARAAITF